MPLPAAGRPAPEDQDESMHGGPHDEEATVIHPKPRPKEPTSSERDLHDCSGHVPYRSWCRACVAGRGRSDAHADVPKDPRAVPIIAIDYGYLETRDEAAEAGDTPSPIL
eukprot:6478558-Amphidinium_carterae.1